MVNQTQEAQNLMQEIEKEEAHKQLQFQQEHGYIDHADITSISFIVNLVIGTLYCAKGKYSFGISRIIKSFEAKPNISVKLSNDTWFHAKRCILSLIENLTKNMLVFPDDDYQQLISFLTQ